MSAPQPPASTSPYIGRFAPSPTGPLHMGSLVAAVAGFLDARANRGTWLLRMEDLDPPREPPGAADRILEQLQTFGLDWDGEVLYQSTRHEAYAEALEKLDHAGMTYACDCSRRRVREQGSVYDGRCRKRGERVGSPHAIRLRVEPESISFHDAIQGDYGQDMAGEVGDFVIRRKDGLFAYQLAVVVDDAWQGVTHVLRGYDLIDSTPRQVYLQRLLGLPTPAYAHIPILVDRRGDKLSKQTFASAIAAAEAGRTLQRALAYLDLETPTELAGADCAQLLDWAIEHWELQRVPKLATIPESPIPEPTNPGR